MRKHLVTGVGNAINIIGRSTSLRVALVATSLAAFAFAVFASHYAFLAIVVGLACLFIVATTVSEAGRLARALQRLQKHSVDVRVWGTELGELEVDRITAVGAGLLIYVRSGTLLKIAQPRAAQIGEHSVEIGDAAYVSWGGTKLERVAGVPAFRLAQLPAITPGEAPPGQADGSSRESAEKNSNRS